MLIVIANLLAWRPLPGTEFYVGIRRMHPKKWGYFWGQSPRKELFRPLSSMLETLHLAVLLAG